MKNTLNNQEGGNHYKNMAIQPIEFIIKNGLGFIEGNIIKYVCRYKDKNGLEDLKKARHYLDMLIEDSTTEKPVNGYGLTEDEELNVEAIVHQLTVNHFYEIRVSAGKYINGRFIYSRAASEYYTDKYNIVKDSLIEAKKKREPQVIEVDMSNICEAAHTLTVNECEKKNIKVDDTSKENGYTNKASEIFKKYYDILISVFKI